MDYLADTNVAMRRVLPNDPQHIPVTIAIQELRKQELRKQELRKQELRKQELRKQGLVIYITPQVLVEFYALATRPIEANGLGLSATQARSEANKMEALFPLLPEVPLVYVLWRNLVDTYGVIGRQVYDARLVAVMQAYEITHLLTMNPTHFRRFMGITVVEPQNVR